MNIIDYFVTLKQSPTPFIVKPNYYQQLDEGRQYFPYPDFFRGNPFSTTPVILDREAGYQLRKYYFHENKKYSKL